MPTNTKQQLCIKPTDFLVGVELGVKNERVLVSLECRRMHIYFSFKKPKASGASVDPRPPAAYVLTLLMQHCFATSAFSSENNFCSPFLTELDPLLYIWKLTNYATVPVRKILLITNQMQNIKM